MIKIIIDGNNFSNEEEFYTEIDKLLTKGLTWKTGHNLAAFNDLLRGGFGVHEHGKELDITWINASKSRKDLGYEETAKHWKDSLKICHENNIEIIKKKIFDAEHQVGETLFDKIIGIIQKRKCKLTIKD